MLQRLFGTIIALFIVKTDRCHYDCHVFNSVVRQGAGTMAPTFSTKDRKET